MSNHTPGPWKYLGCATTRDNDTVEWPTVEVAPKRYIKPEGSSFEECEANARLIAAAPDMLKLIQRAGEIMIDLESLIDGAFTNDASAQKRQWHKDAAVLLAKIQGGGDE